MCYIHEFSTKGSVHACGETIHIEDKIVSQYQYYTVEPLYWQLLEVSWFQSQRSKWIEMTNLGLSVGVLNREVSSRQRYPLRVVPLYLITSKLNLCKCISWVGDISPTSGKYITYKWEIYHLQVGDISPTSGRYTMYKWEIYRRHVGDITYKW
jgi:hypothetical protein